MFKRLFLLRVTGLLVLTSSLVFAQEGRMLPGCEIGDALFSKMNFWGVPLPGIERLGHIGVYYCSSSRKGPEAWNPETDLVNSNMKYGVIEAALTFDGAKVQITPITFSHANTFYLGAYNTGGLKAGDRIDIVKCAYNQREARAPNPLNWRWPLIKKPNSSSGSGDGSFRCDGLVEYCYEVMV